MLSFRMLIEALNQPFDWTWDGQYPNAWTASFIVEGDRKFSVTLSYVSARDYGKVWYVAFSDEVGSVHLTGKGQAFRILSTVVAILKDFIEHQEPLYLYIGADDNHAKIYAAMIKRYSKASDFRDYTWKQEKGPYSTVFLLIRKED